MPTWGFANWENSQTTFDYRHNRDLESPLPQTTYSAPNAQYMANRFHIPRKTGMDSSNSHTGAVLFNTNRIEINPNRNGYVTATIRRNNLPVPNNNKQRKCVPHDYIIVC